MRTKEEELEYFRNTEKYKEHTKLVLVTSPKEKDLRMKKAEILDDLVPLKRKVKEMEKRTRELDEQIKYLIERAC